MGILGAYFVLVAKLATFVASPAEDLEVGAQRQDVLGAAGDLDDQPRDPPVQRGLPLAARRQGLEGPGVDYDSENYRWFCERYERFVYVDRVVVAPDAWGMGIGRALYTEFVSAADGNPVLCAEVNLLPRNDRSLVFHEMFGFMPVGEQATEGGSKRVQMLVLEL